MKYIIFDLDGTLSRTDKFMIPSIELAMEKMNISLKQFRQRFMYMAKKCLKENTNYLIT